jgi:hypothetical protein
VIELNDAVKTELNKSGRRFPDENKLEINRAAMEAKYGKDNKALFGHQAIDDLYASLEENNKRLDALQEKLNQTKEDNESFGKCGEQITNLENQIKVLEDKNTQIRSLVDLMDGELTGNEVKQLYANYYEHVLDKNLASSLKEDKKAELGKMSEEEKNKYYEARSFAKHSTPEIKLNAFEKAKDAATRFIDEKIRIYNSIETVKTIELERAEVKVKTTKPSITARTVDTYCKPCFLNLDESKVQLKTKDIVFEEMRGAYEGMFVKSDAVASLTSNYERMKTVVANKEKKIGLISKTVDAFKRNENEPMGDRIDSLSTLFKVYEQTKTAEKKLIADGKIDEIQISDIVNGLRLSLIQVNNAAKSEKQKLADAEINYTITGLELSLRQAISDKKSENEKRYSLKQKLAELKPADIVNGLELSVRQAETEKKSDEEELARIKAKLAISRKELDADKENYYFSHLRESEFPIIVPMKISGKDELRYNYSPKAFKKVEPFESIPCSPKRIVLSSSVWNAVDSHLFFPMQNNNKIIP